MHDFYAIGVKLALHDVGITKTAGIGAILRKHPFLTAAALGLGTAGGAAYWLRRRRAAEAARAAGAAAAPEAAHAAEAARAVEAAPASEGSRADSPSFATELKNRLRRLGSAAYTTLENEPRLARGLLGGASGAALGAAIGGKKNRGLGALLGGGLGALGGVFAPELGALPIMIRDALRRRGEQAASAGPVIALPEPVGPPRIPNTSDAAAEAAAALEPEMTMAP